MKNTTGVSNVIAGITQKRLSYVVAGKRMYTIAAGIYTPSAEALVDTQCLDDFRLLYLLSGHGILTDAYGVSRNLIPGSIVYRKPGMRHTIERSGDGTWNDFFITLPLPIYSPLASAGFIPDLSHDMPPTPEINAAIGAVMNALHSTVPSDMVLSRILSLFALFEDVHHRTASVLLRKIDDACEALMGDFTKDINIPALSKRLELGYEQFRKEFKRVTGYAPKEFRIRKKIEHAQRVLSTEPVSVGVLSSRLGYPTQFAFAKQFKKYTGLSPMQFKRSVW
ncbi:MAG: helix-turn-helix transcriptional regulator [Spirochaetes bacterium]|nr:helix-turn-helix transcriptional regulator [Spirochaetota bacterium]